MLMFIILTKTSDKNGEIHKKLTVFHFNKQLLCIIIHEC